MKTKATIIVCAILALAGGFAFRSIRKANQNRAAIDALASQRAALQATITKLEQRLQTASAARARLGQSLDPVPGTPNERGMNAAAGSGPSAKSAIRPRRITAETIVMEDPRRVAEYLRNYCDGIELEYGGMFKTARFSPAQIETFKEIAASSWVRNMDLMLALWDHGLDRDSGVYEELARENEKIRMAEEARLLGDVEPLCREFRQTDGVRYHVRQLAGAAVYSGEPATLDQVEQATKIIAAHCERDTRGFAKEWTVNWPAARPQLQEVLSPTQVATLGLIMEKAAAYAKVNLLKMSLAAEFKAKQAAK